MMWRRRVRGVGEEPALDVSHFPVKKRRREDPDRGSAFSCVNRSGACTLADVNNSTVRTPSRRKRLH